MYMFTIFSFWQIAFVNNIHDFTFVEALCAQGNLTPFFNLLLKRYSSKPRLGPSFSEGGLGAPPSVDPTQVIHWRRKNSLTQSFDCFLCVSGKDSQTKIFHFFLGGGQHAGRCWGDWIWRIPAGFSIKSKIKKKHGRYYLKIILIYCSLFQLDKILDAQEPQSRLHSGEIQIMIING